MIFEDILHFENDKKNLLLDDELIIERARSIATRMLKEKADMMPESKNIEFIFEAIEKAEKVNKSEG